jgi:hypothetical protein
MTMEAGVELSRMEEDTDRASRLTNEMALLAA